ncbi:MAG: hypothetical protein ACPGD5_09895 [Salibacteraceae bacterium]
MGLTSKIKTVIYNTGFYAKYDALQTNKLRKQMVQNGLKSICDFNWSALKTSDTLFVLGSGSSVMNLSSAEWEIVNQHDSLGFNAWSLHEFVPTYYAIETSKNQFVANLRKDHLNNRLKDYSNTPIFIQYQHMLMAGIDYNDLKLPKENLYYNAPFMPNTTNVKVLKKLIAKWVNQKDAGLCDLMHYSSSLSYMIGLGYLMGYKNIVLLGVDLGNSGYFFEHENANEPSKEFSKIYQKEIRSSYTPAKDGSHTTVSKKVTAQYGCLPIDVFVKEVKEALNGVGVTIYTGNDKSRLYPMLPHYKF